MGCILHSYADSQTILYGGIVNSFQLQISKKQQDKVALSSDSTDVSKSNEREQYSWQRDGCHVFSNAKLQIVEWLLIRPLF
jgi:hypothetical protein